jgi:hypothetical protein
MHVFKYDWVLNRTCIVCLSKDTQKLGTMLVINTVIILI